MRTTTLLEVMAEVGTEARRIESEDVPAVWHISELLDWSTIANDDIGMRREALKNAAARAILALHAHDAEAARAGT